MTITQLKHACINFHKSEKNDIEKFNEAGEIRCAAYKSGFSREEVSEIMVKASKYVREKL